MARLQLIPFLGLVQWLSLLPIVSGAPPPAVPAPRVLNHLPHTAAAEDIDALIADLRAEASIDSYVHFGDSYAAGLGAGETSSDSCRRGSNNYGALAAEVIKPKDFYSVPCSGDTTKGVNLQIDGWAEKKKEGRRVVSTLTVGGNDVLFGDMAKNCLITPGLGASSSSEKYREDCLATQKKARDLMEDSGPDGLGAKLMATYGRILDIAESSQNVTWAHLFVPGYVSFFNDNTEDCDFTTFYLWEPTWDKEKTCCKVYLSREIRKELNGLVQMLNNLIEDTISRTNAARGSQNIHYIDMQPHFDGHRWCETNGDTYHEPDENVESTYFFLSDWKDFPIERQGRAARVDASNTKRAAEVAEFMDNGGIQLPPAETCQQDLGSDPDPYAVYMCERSIEIAAAPNGPAAQRMDRATTAMNDGDVHSQDIGWFIPTEKVKTFHPRSPGMVLYRNSVISALVKELQASREALHLA
ncbi:hypothetical protein FQN54_009891 [Arachnomyces sp. PD_36]|nr:hypothetical protein FQN54_009891 [Arachnomyces sp. PD_36]